jgi:hypothetical protein
VEGREGLRAALSEHTPHSSQSLDKNHTHFFLVDDGSEVRVRMWRSCVCAAERR